MQSSSPRVAPSPHTFVDALASSSLSRPFGTRRADNRRGLARRARPRPTVWGTEWVWRAWAIDRSPRERWGGGCSLACGHRAGGGERRGEEANGWASCGLCVACRGLSSSQPQTERAELFVSGMGHEPGPLRAALLATLGRVFWDLEEMMDRHTSRWGSAAWRSTHDSVAGSLPGPGRASLRSRFLGCGGRCRLPPCRRRGRRMAPPIGRRSRTPV